MSHEKTKKTFALSKGKWKTKYEPVRIPKHISFLTALPQRITVRISAWFTTVLNNAGAIPFTRAFLKVTDPLFMNNGTATIVPYWTEWAALYRKFEVLRASDDQHWGSSEAYITFPGAVALNYQPPFASTAEIAGYFGNQYSKIGVLGASTGNSTYEQTLNVNVAKVSGFATDLADTGLVGDASGLNPPVNNVYIFYGTDNGTPSVSGIRVGHKVTVDVDFMERQTPQN